MSWLQTRGWSRDNQARAGLIGKHVIDVFGYNQEMHDYLIAHGAVVFMEPFPLGHQTERFAVLHFPGCKPVRHRSWSEPNEARIFFPTQDDALLFSVVFGHKIEYSHVKQIQQLIDEKHE